MKRYELKKIADGGLLYLEESDIVAVRPRKGDDLFPVEVELRNRDAYTIDDGFRYNARSRTVTIRLSVRQARELIEQDREAQGKDFCGDAEGHGCFDFGKSTDPEECARCRTIHALHAAGQGDLRKIRIPLPAPKSYVLAGAFTVLLILWVWTLNQWANTAQQVDQSRQELAGCQRIKLQSAPPP